MCVIIAGEWFMSVMYYLSCLSNQEASGPRCACKTGYVPTEDNLKCLDIDECASKTHDCTSQQMCVNIAGKWVMSVITIFHVCLTKKHQEHEVHVNQDTYQQKIT